MLATGIWAIWRELKDKRQSPARASLSLSLFLLGAAWRCSSSRGSPESSRSRRSLCTGRSSPAPISCLAGAVIRAIWLPLVYLAFTLPPPDTVVAAVTQPIKIAISSWAVTVLHALGYPIASSGVTIQIGQYELLVAAACAGLNSIMTLTALCMFYVYLRHRSNPIAFLMIAIAAIPVAIMSNFVRVLVLVLITYHFGDAAGAGVSPRFRGLLMFAIALLAIFGVDKLVSPLSERRAAA